MNVTEAATLQANDRVMYERGTEYECAVTVTSVNGTCINFASDDGTKGSVHVADMRAFSLSAGEPVCVMSHDDCTETQCDQYTSGCPHTSDDDQPKTARERKHEKIEREMSRYLYSDPLKWNRLFDSLDS